MAELTHDELGLVVMAQVMAGCLTAESLLSQNRQTMPTHTTFPPQNLQKTFLHTSIKGKVSFCVVEVTGAAGT